MAQAEEPGRISGTSDAEVEETAVGEPPRVDGVAPDELLGELRRLLRSSTLIRAHAD